jgi:hypothetical protein
MTNSVANGQKLIVERNSFRWKARNGIHSVGKRETE